MVSVFPIKVWQKMWELRRGGSMGKEEGVEERGNQ